MKICGIDDAGRGSMIGPLVIAGISIEKKNLKKLKPLVYEILKNYHQKCVRHYIKK